MLCIASAAGNYIANMLRVTTIISSTELSKLCRNLWHEDSNLANWNWLPEYDFQLCGRK